MLSLIIQSDLAKFNSESTTCNLTAEFSILSGHSRYTT